MASDNTALRINGSDPLFDTTNMIQKVFPSDFRQVRYFTLLIVQSAPVEIKEHNILEQQVSEIIKNAIKHGNRCDTNKKVTVWYSFSKIHAHLIVMDEGSGFQELERWNAFNQKRLACLAANDFSALGDYLAFRTAQSDEQDNGISLFAALEYWNGGIVFNEQRNAVAVLRKYAPGAPKK